jgi:hypothetical protein
MQQFEIVSFIEITGGKVQLTEEQAKARIHNLKEIGGGVYTVLGPIGFKKGEVLGLDGFEPPKGQAKALAPVGEVEINTVADLAKVLGKKVDETVAFLKEDYSFEAKNGKTDVPEDLFTVLAEDGVIQQ